MIYRVLEEFLQDLCNAYIDDCDSQEYNPQAFSTYEDVSRVSHMRFHDSKYILRQLLFHTSIHVPVFPYKLTLFLVCKVY